MTTLWVYAENGRQQWTWLGCHDPHKRSDYYNKKYWHRHFWVSDEAPGEKELQIVKEAKERSDLDFVDRHEPEGENPV